ncbi:MAG: alanine racemase [Clostridia bacterium]|nr:alanine racemase [Clostridia bacterium]
MDYIFDSLRAWAQIDLDAVRNNHMKVKSLLPEGVKIAAVIKADAYGHGAGRIARLLEHDTDYFAVAMTDEAEALRRDGIRKPILVLAHTPVGDLPRLARFNIETSVSTLDEAVEISEFAARRNCAVGVHIAIDTGMCRIGFDATEASAREIAEITRLPGVDVKGIFSHFAAADTDDPTFTRAQTEKFDFVLGLLEKEGINIPIKHICNSAGTLGDAPKYDMVREGILLYGLAPSDEISLDGFGSPSPAMSLKTHVSSVRRVPAGTPVSYGCTYVTSRESVIATLQVGYADGVPRMLSGKGDVLIRGKRAPIAGRVCMDQMMVDVTDVDRVSVGDVATIIGGDGDEFISADEVARLSGTIGYEIVCGISKRVPRVYTEDGEVTGVLKMLRD